MYLMWFCLIEFLNQKVWEQKGLVKRSETIILIVFLHVVVLHLFKACFGDLWSRSPLSQYRECCKYFTNPKCSKPTFSMYCCLFGLFPVSADSQDFFAQFNGCGKWGDYSWGWRCNLSHYGALWILLTMYTVSANEHDRLLCLIRPHGFYLHLRSGFRL